MQRMQGKKVVRAMKGLSSTTTRPHSRSKRPIAIFIGRFQPFHIGHYDAFLRMNKLYPRVNILIGSSNRSRTQDNPLTYTERKDYIRSVVGPKPTILPLRDVPCDDDWVSLLRRHFPQTPVVIYSANDWVLHLCEEASIPTRRIIIRKKVSATTIRQMIRERKTASLRLFPNPKPSAKLLQTIWDTRPKTRRA